MRAAARNNKKHALRLSVDGFYFLFLSAHHSHKHTFSPFVRYTVSKSEKTRRTNKFLFFHVESLTVDADGYDAVSEKKQSSAFSLDI